MATINDIGGVGDPLGAPPLGGPTGWAAAVRDKLVALDARGGGGFTWPVFPGSSVSQMYRLGADNYLIPVAGDQVTGLGSGYPTPVGVPITGVSVWCTTAGAGETVLIAVYESGANGLPAALLRETTIDVSTTGQKRLSFSATPTGPILWVFFGSTGSTSATRFRGMNRGTAYVNGENTGAIGGITGQPNLRLVRTAGAFPASGAGATVGDGDGKTICFMPHY